MQKKMSISHLNLRKIIFSKQEFIDYTNDLIQNNLKELVITLNTEMFVDSMNDDFFREIIENSSIVIDSVGISYLFLKKSGKWIEPLNGIEIAQELIKSGYRVFIVGSTEENINKAVINLRNLYPQSNIVGYYHGYFSNDYEVINIINQSNPEVLLVGLGSPKQEKWIYKNIDNLKFNLAIGIGGSIDVWAGVYKRAPLMLRKLRLEWLYRFLVDFKRIPRIKKLIKFAILVKTGRI